MRRQYPVSVACEVLQVSASRYFSWQRRRQLLTRQHEE